MGKEMIVSASRHETRVAIMEDEQLSEIYFERANEYSLAGSIHKGRVTRVLPGMQSAFVSIGLERDAFLYVSDFFEEHEEFDELPVSDSKPVPEPRSRVVVTPRAPKESKEPKEARDTREVRETAEPAQEQDAGSRDRRGRRGRRRRGRGGQNQQAAIPESKYAQPDAARQESEEPRVEKKVIAAARREEPEVDVAEEPDNDILILPGESLAKYRGRPSEVRKAPPAAVPESDEPESGSDDDDDPDTVASADSDDQDQESGGGRRRRRRGSRRRRGRRGRGSGRGGEETDDSADSSTDAVAVAAGAAALAASADEEDDEEEDDETATSSLLSPDDTNDMEDVFPLMAAGEDNEAESPRTYDDEEDDDDDDEEPAIFDDEEDDEEDDEDDSDEDDEEEDDDESDEDEDSEDDDDDDDEDDEVIESRYTDDESDFPFADSDVDDDEDDDDEEDEDQEEEDEDDDEEEDEDDDDDEDDDEVLLTAAVEDDPDDEDDEILASAAEFRYDDEDEDEDEEDRRARAKASAMGDEEDDEAARRRLLDEDDGPPPVRIPLSLTATLRERGGRFLQRRSPSPSGGGGNSGGGGGGRRRRGRRGRGRKDDSADMQDVSVDSNLKASEPVVEEKAPEPSRPERSERSERSGRGRDRDRDRDKDRDKDRDQSKDRSDRRSERDRPRPQIADLLKSGQEILVQIAKEPIAQKGARITSHIALPGRYVVYMPTVEHMGVSRKIGSEAERNRLRKILQTHGAGLSGGFIIRTAGTGRTEEEIAADMNFLYNQWLDIRTKAEKTKAPALIYHDLNVVERVMRDQLDTTFKNIWVDNEEVYEETIRFVQRFQPSLVDRVRLYTRREPIMDAFGVSQELDKALKPKVWLKSGGYIVINQTEALVAIDVNTGKYVGRSDKLEDTITKTNTEAVKEIARQMKLRDLGGIIVIDFIDMDERKNRVRVMQALEEAMRTDRAPYKILQFNDFGLVAITRKRVKQSLERTLCSPCPVCSGSGSVKSVETVISEILVEAQKLAPAIEGKDVVIRCSGDVASVLKSHRNNYLEELEEVFSRPVIVKGDAALHRENFDIA